MRNPARKLTPAAHDALASMRAGWRIEFYATYAIMRLGGDTQGINLGVFEQLERAGFIAVRGYTRQGDLVGDGYSLALLPKRGRFVRPIEAK